MLTDAIPEAILLVRADGTIARANGLAERMFGYAPDALRGRPVSDLMPAAGRAEHTGHIQRYLASPTVRPMGKWQTLLATRHDGSEFPVEIALGSVTEDAEVMAVASIRDTTEARQAERQTRLREHQLHVSMELARIGTWEFNPVRDTRAFSPGMMALLQRTEPFLSSAEFFAAVHPDDRESIRARMGRAIATGEPYRVVVRMLRADGVTLSLDSHVSTERDADGRVELLRGVVMDVTEHLAARERLQQSTQNW